MISTPTIILAESNDTLKMRFELSQDDRVSEAAEIEPVSLTPPESTKFPTAMLDGTACTLKLTFEIRTLEGAVLPISGICKCPAQ